MIVGYLRSVNNSREEKSEKSAAENELDTDAASSTDESEDAEDVCICGENLFDDEEFQNFEFLSELELCKYTEIPYETWTGG